jgi:predicted enzyme related to lactoylglutathione lyase
MAGQQQKLEEYKMATKIRYDGVINCALNISDLGKALAWYQDVLGFELIYKLDDMGWAEVTSPTANVTLGLSQVEKVETGAGGATVVFGVVDIDEARGQLEQRDVRFDGETMTIPEMVRLATFFDPDGNKFMLAQDLSKKC